ncbi:MAG: hypothetical protein ACKN9V_01310, partial [Pseudomonadota bacterium]
MKWISVLFLGLTVFEAQSAQQQAEAFFRNYEFKKALASWVALYEKSSGDWGVAKKVADLQLLLEGRAKA